MKRFLILCFAILFSTLSIGLFGGSSVNAASLYDDAYDTVDAIYIKGSQTNTCPQVDISLDWLIRATDPSSYYGSDQSTTVENAWDAMIANPDGAYAISQLSNSFFGENTVLRVWFAPDGADLVWGNDSSVGNYVRIQSDNVFIFDFSMTTSSQTCQQVLAPSLTGGFGYRDYSSFNVNSVISNSGGSNNDIWKNWYAQNFNVIYPNDYEGEEIVDSWSPPIINNYSPDIRVNSGLNWRLQFTDTNFNTFDPVPFTCANELTPTIRYVLHDPDDVPIVDDVVSPTVPYNVEVPLEYRVAGEYKLVAIYQCPPEDNINFPNGYLLLFNLDESGVYTDFFENVEPCISTVLPFFDFDECRKVISQFVNALTFGYVTLVSPIGVIPLECSELGTIGDWLGLQGSNRIVCPQMPAYVRNTVTPFVILGVAYSVLGRFLTRSTREIS